MTMNLGEFFLKNPNSRAKIKDELKVTYGFISHMATGRKPIPIKYCATIERLTNGEVSRKEMYPNDWQKIWPELSE